MSSKPSQILYSSFLTCLLFLILTITTNAQDYVMRVCNTTSNYTQGSQYRSNLNHTLTTLASNITPNGFNTTISGAGPNQVYGLLQCRGDVSYQVCRTCANISTMEILQQCPNNKEAVMFYDFCMLQFADHPIFSKPNLEIVVHLRNVQNTTTPALFNRVLRELMGNLSSKAASDPSKFAIGGAPFGDRGNLYGLVQCNRDLSETDCLRCLQAMYEFRTNTTRFQKSIGAQIWSTTCNIRYENYLFYESSTKAPSPAPPGAVNGNPSTRTNNTSSNHGGKKSNTKNVIIIVVSAVLASLLLFSICICCLWKKIIKGRDDVKEDAVKYTGSEIEGSESLVFDLATLKLATNNFSEKFKLGEGGFGGVYKGELSDGREIAVKRLDRYSGQGLEELKTEVVLVAKLMHRNLVKLLGFCIDEVEKILVYEYLPNGSLDKMLFDQGKCLLLDWDKRFNIIIGIARGLLYLHQDSQVRIVHRDLKASNILLDEDMNAKISDFGLARLFCESQAEENTNRIAGTYGYMAPEYTIQGQYSTKSDVFSFGVLILEIVSGRKNSSFSDSTNLPTFAWKHWNNGAALEIVDPTLGQQWVPSEIIKCIQLGLLCVQQEAADRPSMAEVFLWLNSNSVTCSVPAQPAYFVEGITTDSDITKENAWLTESEKSNMKSPQQSVNYVTVTDITPR